MFFNLTTNLSLFETTYSSNESLPFLNVNAEDKGKVQTHPGSPQVPFDAWAERWFEQLFLFTIQLGQTLRS